MGFMPNGSNAISKFVTGYHFKKELSEEIINEIIASKDYIKENTDYSSHKLSHSFTVNVVGENKSEQSQKISGVIFEEYKGEEDSQELSWSLEVQSNKLIVTCFDYTRWKEVKEKALTQIKLIDDKFTNNEEVTTIIFQVEDILLNKYDADKKSSELAEALNFKSEYLPQHIENRGKVWHANQGWFDYNLTEKGMPEYMRLLNNVMVAAQINLNDKKEREHWFIRVFHDLRLIPNFDNRQKKIEYREYIDSVLETSHESNKNLLKSLFTEKIQSLISLS